MCIYLLISVFTCHAHTMCFYQLLYGDVPETRGTLWAGVSRFSSKGSSQRHHLTRSEDASLWIPPHFSKGPTTLTVTNSVSLGRWKGSGKTGREAKEVGVLAQRNSCSVNWPIAGLVGRDLREVQWDVTQLRTSPAAACPYTYPLCTKTNHRLAQRSVWLRQRSVIKWNGKMVCSGQN